MSADCVAFSGELALRHEAQVGAADLELGLDDVEGAAVVGERLREDRFALAGRDLGRQGAFHVAERAQADRGVGRRRPAAAPRCGSPPVS